MQIPVHHSISLIHLLRSQLTIFPKALEDKFGGRVCPMMFLNENTNADPFILLVHHRHSFNRLDPFRYLTRLIIPEGFPSHPHRGMSTLTYVLQGSLRHRDSMGFKQIYSGGSAQFLRASKGILHEEMWHLTHPFHEDLELFQVGGK